MRARVTIEGNAGWEPALRFTQTEKAVAEFPVIVNNRRQIGGEWRDGEPTRYAVQVWGRMAENVAESVRKGDRVIVAGYLYTEKWIDKPTGEIRTTLKLNADSVGLALTFHSAKSERPERPASTEDVQPEELEDHQPADEPGEPTL